jgi:hypothetical protein
VFIGEAIGIGIAFNVSPLIVLQAAFEFDLETIRPGWGVLLAGLCVVAVDLVRSRLAAPRKPINAAASARAAE